MQIDLEELETSINRMKGNTSHATYVDKKVVLKAAEAYLSLMKEQEVPLKSYMIGGEELLKDAFEN